MTKTLALVVPSLHAGGGVPAVARFVADAAQRDGNWRVRPISLSTSAGDAENTALRKPATWLRPPRVGLRPWRGMSVPHFGARFGELEFQRYRRRPELAAELAHCDVIQVVSGSPAWANAVLDFGKPVSLQVATRAVVERRQRDLLASGMRGRWRAAMTGITNRLDDRALGRVDAIQLENPWMLDYARQRNAARPGVDIRYAPPGIDATRFLPLPERRPQREASILCVGRLGDPRKRIGLLLEACALLPEPLRNRMRLVLAGALPPPDSFWQRARTLGLQDRIDWHPRPAHDQLIALYQRASVFALPSDEEGLGIVVLEAMACGVPVVSTRSGGPDGILTDGEDGYLTPRDDAKAMAERLGCLLQDAERNLRMGHAARRTIEQRYAQEVAGAQFVAVWEQLANHEHPPA